MGLLEITGKNYLGALGTGKGGTEASAVRFRNDDSGPTNAPASGGDFINCVFTAGPPSGNNN